MSIILAGYDWIPDPVFGANSCQAGGEVYLHFLQNNFNFYVKRFGSETRYPGHSVDKIQLVNRRDSPDAVWNIYSSKTKSDYTFPPKQAFLWFSNTQQPKFQRDFNVLMPVTSFEALFKERGGGSHTAHKDNKHARGICINVAALPLAIFRQTIILVWLSTYDRVLQSITEYYKVLQSITKTNLAHLLEPIFGLVPFSINDDIPLWQKQSRWLTLVDRSLPLGSKSLFSTHPHYNHDQFHQYRNHQSMTATFFFFDHRKLKLTRVSIRHWKGNKEKDKELQQLY